MIKQLALFASAAAAAAAFTAPASAQSALSPGIWTNNEDVYFGEEEGREKARWAGFEVDENGQWRRINAFGEPQSQWSSDPIPALSQRAGSGQGGYYIGNSQLRKARPVSCWVSVRKFAGKPDGSEDWTFANNLKTFDQGGRVTISGGGTAPDVTIRIRNVTWAKGSRNKPSLVLYVHKQDPVRAESYSWASPDASLVGVNLRWVQSSCSRTDI